MDTLSLEKHFNRIGARLRVSIMDDRMGPRSRFGVDLESPVTLDVSKDRIGELFELRAPVTSNAEVFAVNVQPKERHLLMAIRNRGTTSKLLCGHDERHWFVAGLPDFANGAGTVRAAKDALKPTVVRTAETRLGIRQSDRYRRKNEAFLRQGEWFFLPRPDTSVNPLLILRDEPLRRASGGGKPHCLEECVRQGGEQVYVCRQRPAGLDVEAYQKLLSRKPEAKSWNWIVQRRNPTLFARGRVRHQDHATIFLNGWHEVAMNTEGQSVASKFVAFLD